MKEIVKRRPALKVHESVTLARCLRTARDAMITLASPGICIACGADADNVDPLAGRYRCEGCGAHAVYGAEDLVLRLAP